MTVGVNASAVTPTNVMPAQAGIHASWNRASRMYDRQAKEPCIYILASGRNGVLYVGVTSELSDRVSLHKQEIYEGFTKKHKVHTLVYFEMHETMEQAIRREKQIKRWNRAWKIRLIEQMNPEWQDLSDESCEIQASGTGGVVPPDEMSERED